MCVCVCVCVCVLGGNAINPEIMNHLESGVGAHFDQILGRFHKMAGPCQGVSGRLNSARIGLKLALGEQSIYHKYGIIDAFSIESNL